MARHPRGRCTPSTVNRCPQTRAPAAKPNRRGIAVCDDAVDTVRVETQALALPLDLVAFLAAITRKKPLAEAGKLDAYEKGWNENVTTR